MGWLLWPIPECFWFQWPDAFDSLKWHPVTLWMDWIFVEGRWIIWQWKTKVRLLHEVSIVFLQNLKMAYWEFPGHVKVVHFPVKQTHLSADLSEHQHWLVISSLTWSAQTLLAFLQAVQSVLEEWGKPPWGEDYWLPSFCLPKDGIHWPLSLLKGLPSGNVLDCFLWLNFFWWLPSPHNDT